MLAYPLVAGSVEDLERAAAARYEDREEPVSAVVLCEWKRAVEARVDLCALGCVPGEVREPALGELEALAVDAAVLNCAGHYELLWVRHSDPKVSVGLCDAVCIFREAHARRLPRSDPHHVPRRRREFCVAERVGVCQGVLERCAEVASYASSCVGCHVNKRKVVHSESPRCDAHALRSVAFHSHDAAEGDNRGLCVGVWRDGARRVAEDEAVVCEPQFATNGLFNESCVAINAGNVIVPTEYHFPRHRRYFVPYAARE